MTVQDETYSPPGGRNRKTDQPDTFADRHTRAFIAALESHDLGALKRIPKSDLHNHGKLGMRVESLRRLSGMDVPAPPVNMAGLSGMFTWLQETIRPLSADEGRLKAMYEASVADAAEDGVSVLEMSFELEDGRFFGSPDAYVALASDLKARYAARIRLRPEIGVKKQADLRSGRKLLEAMISSGVYSSIDLYGSETHPLFLRRFTGYFARARKRGLKIKAHVGEFERFSRMRSFIDKFRVSALQHGIKCARNVRDLKWALKRNLVFNVCPASNVILGAAPSIAHHPIRTLFDAGLRVTLNTDDLLVFNESVSDQFLELFLSGLLSAQELDRIRLMGLAEGTRAGVG
jgi:adenosine deaminase